MKVFLSTDMEGTAGVVDWSPCRGPSQEYEYYRGQLQAEVNAAIDGALAAGATEFLVNDSGGTHFGRPGDDR
jgi:D-amino peptidase